MRLDRLTNKTREAIQAAQNDAMARGNPELTPEHFLLTLLEQDGGVAKPLLEKAGIESKSLVAELRRKLNGGNR